MEQRSLKLVLMISAQFADARSSTWRGLQLLVLRRCSVAGHVYMRCVSPCRQGLPVFNKVKVTVDSLIAQGNRLAQEQQMVNDHKLSKEYLKDTGPSQPGLIGLKG